MDDDATLLERWRAGERCSGDALFQRHFDGVFRFFRSKVDDVSAEELTQATFLALLKAADRYAGRSSFRAYVYSIARNQLLMALRKQYNRAKVIDLGSVSAAELGLSPSEIVADREEQRLLARALRHLTLDMQIVLELFYWEGLGTAEIAEVLDVATGTVRSRLARARERLADELPRLAGNPALALSTSQGLETWSRKLRASYVER